MVLDEKSAVRGTGTRQVETVKQTFNHHSSLLTTVSDADKHDCIFINFLAI